MYVCFSVLCVRCENKMRAIPEEGIKETKKIKYQDREREREKTVIIGRLVSVSVYESVCECECEEE